MSVLYNNWGHGFSDPTANQIDLTVAQLLAPADKFAAEGDYAEHSDAWIEVVDANSRLWVIAASRSHVLRLEIFVTADMTDTLLEAIKEFTNTDALAAVWLAALRHDFSYVLTYFGQTLD
jgi:hypothetical protein